MAVQHFTDQTFDQEVLKSDKPVLVDFFADWCGPCRMVSPIVEELAIQFDGKIVVGKLDVDANQKVASDYRVMSIPTVILFEKGKEVARQVGFSGRDGYIKMVEQVVK